jgi:hypothetical protein
VAKSHPGGGHGQCRQYLLTPRGKPSGERGIVTEQGQLSLEPHRLRAELDVPGCRIELDYFPPRASGPCQPLVIPGPSGRAVRWYPLAPLALVSGRVLLDGQAIELDGAPGYADYLFSDLLPRRVPVRLLRWGRLHHPDLVLVYTIAQGVHAREQWSKVLVGAAGTSHLFDDRAELRPDGKARYAIEARKGDIRVRAAVRRASTALEDDFVGSGGTSLLRWFANHPRGRKFFARATVQLENGAGQIRLDDAPLFDEEVVFGAEPCC